MWRCTRGSQYVERTQRQAAHAVPLKCGIIFRCICSQRNKFSSSVFAQASANRNLKWTTISSTTRVEPTKMFYLFSFSISAPLVTDLVSSWPLRHNRRFFEWSHRQNHVLGSAKFTRRVDAEGSIKQKLRFVKLRYILVTRFTRASVAPATKSGCHFNCLINITRAANDCRWNRLELRSSYCLGRALC